jgi:3-methyladenine DNA glycosylase AlkD
MAAYMRTSDPFFGVGTPERRTLLKVLVAAHAPLAQSEYQAQVLALWGIPQREGKYMAVDWATRFKPYLCPQALPLFERLIREGAWWDTVDAVATHLIGGLLLNQRDLMRPVLDQWIEDDCLWIRRTALLAHLKHKVETDEDQLFTHCLKLSAEKEFFIRKAIGWALREYSKTRPEAVRRFLIQHRELFSGLTYREAMKAMARKGAV